MASVLIDALFALAFTVADLDILPCGTIQVIMYL